jgi:hypothetical protein
MPEKSSPGTRGQRPMPLPATPKGADQDRANHQEQNREHGQCLAEARHVLYNLRVIFYYCPSILVISDDIDRRQTVHLGKNSLIKASRYGTNV